MSDTANVRNIFGQLFHLDLDKFNTSAGVGYALSLLFVWALQRLLGPAVYVAGICAALAWLTDVVPEWKARLRGMISFAVGSLAISLAAHVIGTSLLPNVAFIFVVAFAGTIVMVYGVHAYLVGWVLIIWGIIAPLLDTAFGLESVVLGLVAGPAVYLSVALAGAFAGRLLRRLSNMGTEEPVSETEAPGEPPSMLKPANVAYALVVGLVMAVTTLIGWMSVETDPSWIANAALMVIGPNVNQLWQRGVQRAIGTICGVLVGFWIVQTISGTAVLIAVTAIISFLVVATLNVNNSFVAFFWTLYMSLEWSLKGTETVRAAGAERIVAELVGIVIAVTAVFLLHRIHKLRTNPI